MDYSLVSSISSSTFSTISSNVPSLSPHTSDTSAWSSAVRDKEQQCTSYNFYLQSIYIVQTLHTLLLACQLFPIRNIWRYSLLILLFSTLLDPSLFLSFRPSLPLLLFLSLPTLPYPSLPSPHSFSSFWYRCCEC